MRTSFRSRRPMVVAALFLPVGWAQSTMLDLLSSHRPSDAARASSGGPIVSLSDWASSRNLPITLPSAHADVVSLSQYMREHPSGDGPAGGLHPDLRTVRPDAPAPSSPRPSAASPSECYTKRTGEDYAGTRNVTRSGVACRPWALESLHRRDRHEGVIPPENHCRYVDADLGCAACYPECPTAAECRRSRLECCEIGAPRPSCAQPSAEAAVLLWPSAHGAEAASPTASPPPPLADGSFTMRLLARARSAAARSGQGAAPLGSDGRGGQRSAAPSEPPPPPSPPPPDLTSCYTHHDASDYRGVGNVTVNGYVCQRWTAQAPNAHPYRPGTAEWESAGLGDHNYCRRPGGFACAWCFVDKSAPPLFAEKSARGATRMSHGDREPRGQREPREGRDSRPHGAHEREGNGRGRRGDTPGDAEPAVVLLRPTPQLAPNERTELVLGVAGGSAPVVRKDAKRDKAVRAPRTAVRVARSARSIGARARARTRVRAAPLSGARARSRDASRPPLAGLGLLRRDAAHARRLFCAEPTPAAAVGPKRLCTQRAARAS